MINSSSVSPSRPIALSGSAEAKVYGLLALAMALTALGAFLGIFFAPLLLSTGIHIVFLFVELGIIFTAKLWMGRSPLNVVLFALFPLLSGFTITPYLLSVLSAYANGGAILLNAALATACMTGASALFAKTSGVDFSVLGRVLMLSLFGLVFLGIFQIFIPSLQGTRFEVMISGVGILVFSLFIAFDVQRTTLLAKSGGNPFLLALSLYLDIFNLFLYVLRFMVAISGNRR
ncbi:MAG: Bax inhibitor-1 family protein [Candidatus Peregrinibacteria bacterium]